MTSQWCMCVHACTCARDVACACAPGVRQGGGGRRGGKQGMEGDKSNGDKTLHHKHK